MFQIRYLAALFVFVFFLRSSLLYCEDLHDTLDDRLNGSDKESFYDKVLSGKFNFIEEDFYDMPRKLNKFDFIKEKMEGLRTYIRPEDEFAILNLQWKDGSIFINDFTTVQGSFKKRRGVFPEQKKKFFYRLLSEKGEPVLKEYFEIPNDLYFDFINEETGKIDGGELSRSEADFLIKVPLSNKSAQKILFFEETFNKSDLNLIKDRQGIGKEITGFEKKETLLGESLF